MARHRRRPRFFIYPAVASTISVPTKSGSGAACFLAGGEPTVGAQLGMDALSAAYRHPATGSVATTMAVSRRWPDAIAGSGVSDHFRSPTSEVMPFLVTWTVVALSGRRRAASVPAGCHASDGAMRNFRVAP